MLYKALHTLSFTGVLFDADRVYREEQITQAGITDLLEDFIPMEDAEVKKLGLAISEPEPDPGVLQVQRDRAAIDVREQKMAEANAATAASQLENQNQNGGGSTQKAGLTTDDLK